MSLARGGAVEAFARKASTLHQRPELAPREFRVDAVAHAAVGAGDHVVRANPLRVTDDAIGDQLRMLDHVRRVRYYAGRELLPLRELRVLPDVHLVPAPRVGGLQEEGAGVDAEDQVDDRLVEGTSAECAPCQLPQHTW